MKPSLRTALTLFSMIASPCFAQVSVDGATTFSLATVEQGKAILGAEDLYIRNQTDHERGARMRSPLDMPAKAYVAFAEANAVPWTRDETEKLNAILESLAEPMAPYARLFPKTVLFIKTTGKEDYGAAYTRANGVILKQGTVDRPAAKLRQIIAHECFHVLSRNQPELRDRIYAAIGFEKCGELIWPDSLLRRRISNPDAPLYQHEIEATWNGEKHQAMLAILSRSEDFDLDEEDTSGLRFAQSRLLIVEPAEGGKRTQVMAMNGKPLVLDPNQVEGLYEKIGRNTAYLAQPEEICADNFCLLTAGSAFIPSPDVLERIKKALLEGAAKASAK